MQYFKSEHYLLDFRTNSRQQIGTYYSSRELVPDQNKIVIAGFINGVLQKFITVLEGKDLLSFKNYVDGSAEPVSEGRFLDKSYEELIVEADMPEKNIVTEGVTTKVSNTLLVHTKTIRDRNTRKVAAVIQEVISPISKEDFESNLSK